MKKKIKYKTPIDESSLPTGLRSNKVGDIVTIFDGGKEKTGKVVSVNNDGSLKIDFTEVKDILLHWEAHRQRRN